MRKERHAQKGEEKYRSAAGSWVGGEIGWWCIHGLGGSGKLGRPGFDSLDSQTEHRLAYWTLVVPNEEGQCAVATLILLMILIVLMIFPDRRRSLRGSGVRS